jgi:hypothetical protein
VDRRADTKVALVIGNSKYESAYALKNPANDALAIKNALAAIGFNVALKQDVTQQEFELTLKEFARDASKSDIALFYFAGHGVQFRGQNYFLPIDIKLVDSNDIEFNAIGMDKVASATSKARKAKIVILDASRNRVSKRTKAASRALEETGIVEGFAPIVNNIENADGMIVFYSAEPGKAAEDGEGANSPFAQSLAKRIVEQNKKIQEVFQEVSSDVKTSTKDFQHPSIAMEEVTTDVILNPVETAEELWKRIRNSTDPADYRRFIMVFPDSELADAAQAKLDKVDSDRRAQDEGKARKEAEANAAAAAERAAVENEARLCADDQKALAAVDSKNEDALKAALDTLKCAAVRANASAQIAKLEEDNLRAQKACADERGKFSSIELFAPAARASLTALPQNPACQQLVTDIRGAIAGVDKRIAYAQDELKRLGCYTAKPTGRFDKLTIAAVAEYLKGRHASPRAPQITDAFVDELRQQDFVVCAPPPPSVAAYPGGASPPVGAGRATKQKPFYVPRY